MLLLAVGAIAQTKPDMNALKHFYDFELTGSAFDLVSGADGWIENLIGEVEVVNNAVIEGGLLDLSSEGFLALPGDSIKINSFPELTVEIWCTPNKAANDGKALMLWSFGRYGNPGFYYLFFTPARWGVNVAARMSVGPSEPWANEQGLSFDADIATDVLSHYVLTINAERVMTLYVNGEVMEYDVDGTLVAAKDTLTGNHLLDSVAIDNAFIGRSMYSPDPTWTGTVDLYSIWDAALSPNEVKWLFEQGSKRELPVENSVSSRKPVANIRAFVTNNHLYVNAEDTNNLSVTIFNALGTAVYHTRNFQNGQHLNLRPGMYVVRVGANSGATVQKVIIR